MQQKIFFHNPPQFWSQINILKILCESPGGNVKIQDGRQNGLTKLENNHFSANIQLRTIFFTSRYMLLYTRDTLEYSVTKNDSPIYPKIQDGRQYGLIKQ